MKQEPGLVLALGQLDGFIHIIKGAVEAVRDIAVIAADVGKTHQLIMLVTQLIVQFKRLFVLFDLQVGIVGIIGIENRQPQFGIGLVVQVVLIGHDLGSLVGLNRFFGVAHDFIDATLIEQRAGAFLAVAVMVIVIHRDVDDSIGRVVDIILIVGLGDQQRVIGLLSLAEVSGFQRVQTMQGDVILPCDGQCRVDAGKFTHGGSAGATVAAGQYCGKNQ